MISSQLTVITLGLAVTIGDRYTWVHCIHSIQTKRGITCLVSQIQRH